jgi:hypothetical protein
MTEKTAAAAGTESVTLLPPHSARERFAVVQCEDHWELRLLVEGRIVRREPLPARFAETLVQAVTRDPVERPL